MQFGYYRRGLVLCMASVACALPAGAQFVESTITGFTNGCFTPVGGPACAPVIQNPGTFGLQGGITAASGVLTYLNSAFSVTTVDGRASIGGNPVAGLNEDNLGAFQLNSALAGAAPGGTTFTGMGFTLAVTFTPPGIVGTGTTLMTALLRGTVRNNSTGGVTVDFGSPLPAEFLVDLNTTDGNVGGGPDDGVFVFELNPLLNVNPDPRNPGNTVRRTSVTGRVDVLAGVIGTAVVPEPATVALLATGLVGVGAAAVRRRRTLGS